MSRLLQIMHAEGIANGNRYAWARYYDAPEIEAVFEKSKQETLTWEDIDP